MRNPGLRRFIGLIPIGVSQEAPRRIKKTNSGHTEIRWSCVGIHSGDVETAIGLVESGSGNVEIRLSHVELKISHTETRPGYVGMETRK